MGFEGQQNGRRIGDADVAMPGAIGDIVYVYLSRSWIEGLVGRTGMK